MLELFGFIKKHKSDFHLKSESVFLAPKIMRRLIAGTNAKLCLTLVQLNPGLTASVENTIFRTVV